MAEEEEFVDDGEIIWTGKSGIAGTLVGTVVTLIALTIAEIIDLATLGITSAQASLFGWYGKLVSAPLDAGATATTGLWQAGAASFGMFGAFAFPVAVLIVTVSVSLFLWGALWGVRRFVS